MGDWYTEAKETLLREIADIFAGGESAEEIVTRTYSYLSDSGFIDYDIEKEILYEEYYDGDGPRS